MPGDDMARKGSLEGYREWSDGMPGRLPWHPGGLTIGFQESLCSKAGLQIGHRNIFEEFRNDQVKVVLGGIEKMLPSDVKQWIDWARTKDNQGSCQGKPW